jgi:hypothetical protein
LIKSNLAFLAPENEIITGDCETIGAVFAIPSKKPDLIVNFIGIVDATAFTD